MKILISIKILSLKKPFSFISFLLFSIYFSSVTYSSPPATNFKISLSPQITKTALSGRMFLIISKKDDPEPRLQISWKTGPLIFATDVFNLKEEETVVINNAVNGFPLNSLADIPSGDYYVQALFNIYTKFKRSDGHIIFAHMDQWEGQKFYKSPGNMISPVQKIYLDPDSGLTVKIEINKIIPPVDIPQDTRWVKRIKIKSELLSKFWGHPIYLGAAILLPRDYSNNPHQFYPVEYIQGHFSLRAPHGFRTDPPVKDENDRSYRHHKEDYQFYQDWISDDFPRMICVTFQHPTPYYDDSYAVNSANNGPYGDAILKELIPYIENKFRIIRKPYARILSGGSTGGWEALALQLYHPDFFGGAWVFYPDPVDFHFYGLLNIYDDDNAYEISEGDWRKIERPMNRDRYGQPLNTLREMGRFENVLGPRDRSGRQLAVWEAVFCPVDEDGYPKPLWEIKSGKIDHTVSDYMRDHNYDLLQYLKINWPRIGKKLKGKLHFYCGDMDGYYLNLGVYELEKFLESTKDPYYEGSFEYGRPLQGHGWNPLTTSQLLKTIDNYIKKAEHR